MKTRYSHLTLADRRQIERWRQMRMIPAVLSVEEVGDILAAAPGPGLKYRAALGISDGAGLRAAEVCHLRVQDIDSGRMLIHVEEGKGGRDRKAMLSPGLLDLLRDYWREARPDGWLFPGLPRVNPISPRQLNRAFASAKHMAGVNSTIWSPHEPAGDLLGQRCGGKLLQLAQTRTHPPQEIQNPRRSPPRRVRLL